MSAAKLIRFYVYRHLKRDYVLPHKHSAYELLYYEKGAGRVMLGQNTFEYGKHSCVIIEPNLLHDDYTLEEQTVYCIQFSSDMKLASAVIAPNRNNEKFIKQIGEILSSVGKDEVTGYPVVAEYQLDALLVLLIRLFNVDNSIRRVYQKTVVDYLKKYMNNYIGSKIDFEILSEKIGYTYERTRKIFKQSEGISMYQYLLNLRLAKAQNLLYDKNKKISDIAAECGFSSPIRFNLFFREKMEFSPGEYRKIVHRTYRDNVARKDSDVQKG